MLGRQYHILTRDDRLETVAQDIVQHFLGSGFQGKAMVVSIDKATALCLRRHHGEALVEDAVNALISPDPLRKDFIAHERVVRTLYDAVKPDAAVLEFAPRMSTLTAIADAIRAKTNPEKPDISGVMGQINSLLRKDSRS